MSSVQEETEETADSIDDAGDEAEDTEGQIQSLGSVAQKSFAAFSAATAAATAGLGKLVTSTTQYAKQVDNASEQSGVAAERIQEVAAVAERVSGTSFDSVRDGFKELAIRSQEAAQGAGEAQEAFDRLGISQEFLRQSSTAEVFRRVRQELQGASEQLRIYASEAIFGGEAGEKLAETLGLSSDEFQRLSEQARENGKILSGEQVQALEENRQSWNELTSQLKGTGRQIATDLVPVIQDVLEEVTDLTSGLSDMDSEARKNWLIGTGSVLAGGALISGLARIKASIASIAGTIAGLSSMTLSLGGLLTGGAAGGFGLGAIMDTTSAMGEMSEEAQETAAEMSELMTGLGELEGQELQARLQKIADAQKRLRRRTSKLSGALSAQRQRLAQLKKLRDKNPEQVPQSAIERQKALVAQLENELNTFTDIQGALEGVADRWGQVAKKAQQAADATRQANRLAPQPADASQVEPAGLETPSGGQGIGASIPQRIRGIPNANARIQLLKQRLKEMGPVAEAATTIARRGVLRLSSGLSSAISRAKSIGGAFRNMAGAAVQALKQMIAKLTTAVALSAVLSATGLGGALNLGGGFGEILGNLTFLAEGGIVTGPTPAMIGEAGPEAVIPLDRLNELVGGGAAMAGASGGTVQGGRPSVQGGAITIPLQMISQGKAKGDALRSQTGRNV